MENEDVRDLYQQVVEVKERLPVLLSDVPQEEAVEILDEIMRELHQALVMGEHILGVFAQDMKGDIPDLFTGRIRFPPRGQVWSPQVSAEAAAHILVDEVKKRCPWLDDPQITEHPLGMQVDWRMGVNTLTWIIHREFVSWPAIKVYEIIHYEISEFKMDLEGYRYWAKHAIDKMVALFTALHKSSEKTLDTEEEGE